jgi:hypothetical protein
MPKTGLVLPRLTKTNKLTGIGKRLSALFQTSSSRTKDFRPHTPHPSNSRASTLRISSPRASNIRSSARRTSSPRASVSIQDEPKDLNVLILKAPIHLNGITSKNLGALNITHKALPKIPSGKKDGGLFRKKYRRSTKRRHR